MNCVIHSRVVVGFHEPIRDVTVICDRVPQTGKCLVGELVSAVEHVQRDRVVRSTNVVIRAGARFRVEKKRARTASRPRGAHGTTSRRPIVGRREDHTHDHYQTTGI